jgi:outer membrane receptor protein involved in Fe transport
MNYDTLGLKIVYDFRGISLTSTTSYLKFRDRFSDEEGALGNLFSDIPAHTVSQEVYLNSPAAGPWRWTAGLAYRDAWDKYDQVIPVYYPPDPTTEESKSVAVFGQLTRLFFDDRLEATAGLRYFHDDVIQQELGPNFVNPTGTPTNTDERFHKLSPKASLTWHVNHDLTTYASYAQGFRSGFSQATLLYLAPGLPNARPDNLINYEVGAKGNIGSRISFDTAAYYIHWVDVQTPITILVPGTEKLYDAAILNGQSASGPGFDGLLTFELLKSLTVSASFSYNHLVLDSDVVAQSATFPSGFVVFPKGSRENYSPSTTAGFNVQYSLPLSQQYALRLTGAGNYTSTQYLVRFRGTYNEYTYAPSAFDARLRAALESNHGWTATLFVNNLTGSKGQPFQDTPTDLGGPFEQPRTVGLQVDYHAH